MVITQGLNINSNEINNFYYFFNTWDGKLVIQDRKGEFYRGPGSDEHLGTRGRPLEFSDSDQFLDRFKVIYNDWLIARSHASDKLERRLL